jgi:hypothetical protein
LTLIASFPVFLVELRVVIFPLLGPLLAQKWLLNMNIANPITLCPPLFPTKLAYDPFPLNKELANVTKSYGSRVIANAIRHKPVALTAIVRNVGNNLIEVILQT